MPHGHGRPLPKSPVLQMAQRRAQGKKGDEAPPQSWGSKRMSAPSAKGYKCQPAQDGERSQHHSAQGRHEQAFC